MLQNSVNNVYSCATDPPSQSELCIGHTVTSKLPTTLQRGSSGLAVAVKETTIPFDDEQDKEGLSVNMHPAGVAEGHIEAADSAPIDDEQNEKIKCIYSTWIL